MKKFSKILCAVLMVALLCATVAVFVGAETPTPTMKVTAADRSEDSKKAMFTHSSSSAEGNSLNTISWVASSGTSNPLDMFNSYVVEEDGDESFVALYAHKTMNGMHTQYVATDSKRSVQITNQHFYVVSFDLASQTTLPEKLAVSLLHRNSGGGGTDLASVQIVLKNYVGDLSDGKWVNLTLVGQIDVALNEDGSVNKDNTVNKMHIYANGKYVASVDGALNHGNLLAGKTPDTYNDGNGLFAEGFRIEIPGSSTVNAGESVFIDNLYRHDMTKADAEANGLASVIAEHSALSEWEANTLVSRAGTEIPAFIKIGDKEYNNTNKANEALASNEKLEVEVIGENIAPVTFACDATVTTNGFNLLYTGITGTKFDNSQEGIIEVDAPYKSALSKTPTAGASQIMEVVKYDAPDNLLVNIAQQQLSGDSNAKDFIQQYVESIEGEDNAYISHYVTKDTTVTASNITNYNYSLTGNKKQIHMHTNLQIGSDGKTTGYIIPAAADRTEDMYAIFEWDMYTADGMPYGMYAGITFRNSSGGNVSGTSFYFDGQEVNDVRKGKLKQSIACEKYASEIVTPGIHIFGRRLRSKRTFISQ